MAVIRLSKIERRPGSVSKALDILGCKWTALIVLEMSQGNVRFSKLEQSIEGINPRILSQRLDGLVAEEIITKTKIPSTSVKAEYQLTDKGKDLLPILRSMADWGAKYAN